jgi:hypothetical protein
MVDLDAQEAPIEPSDSKLGRRVRIVAISDSHQHHQRLTIPPADILVLRYNHYISIVISSCD